VANIFGGKSWRPGTDCPQVSKGKGIMGRMQGAAIVRGRGTGGGGPKGGLGGEQTAPGPVGLFP